MDAFINSYLGLKFGQTLARLTPRLLGYPITRLAAKFIASNVNSKLVRAVKMNQWVVSGKNLPVKDQYKAVEKVLWYSARSIFDLYHHIHDLNSAQDLIKIDPTFNFLINRPQFDDEGLIVVGLHMSGFDLAFQWVCKNWVKPLALTIPNPEDGRQLEFELRKSQVIDLVPGSTSGLRRAIRFLKEGGMVVTGIDRPQQNCHPCPKFFGIPAALPTHHIFLALKAKVPIVLAASRLAESGNYHLFASEPILMDVHQNREDAMIKNAEKVLAAAENIIRKDPHQWLISQAVWPEVDETNIS